MGINSKIEWCDHTWNPWYGCPDDGKRSPACDNCYARKWGDTFKGVDFDKEIKRASDKTFNAPLSRKKYKSGDKVFVCSLSDFFHEDVDGNLRHEAYKNVMLERPDLIWIILTKRPENQEQTDIRIPQLLEIPAAVRFVSCEPLLEKVVLPRVDFHCDLCGGTGILGRWPYGKCHHCGGKRNIPAISTDPKFGGPKTPMRSIHWVICGGESGPHARPMHPDWVRSLRDQCRAASVPFFFKQWGEWMPSACGTDEQADINGAVMEITMDGHVYDGSCGIDFFGDSEEVARIGKKQAGRLLDGKEYQEFPEVK